MSLLTTMTTFESAIQKSMTRSSLSVHHTNFLWALCQEFVLSTTQRKPTASGAGTPFLAITARCRESEPMRTWQHDECLLRRPKTQDSLLRRSQDAQGSGGPHLLREPLLGQTLRAEGRGRGIAGSEKEAGGRPEARREG